LREEKWKELPNKIASKIMLTLLLISILTLASDTLLIKANPVITLRQDGNPTASLGIAGAPQGYSRRQGGLYAPDLRDAVWALGGHSSEFGKGFAPITSLSALEIHSLKWNFSSPKEWSSFAYVNKDSAELVIGVNSTWQINHDELTGYLLENGGRLVDTVSMGNETRAVTVDVPLSSVHSFATEVETANLASYVEPNVRYKVDFVPNDPEWSLQWGPQKIAADWAWNTTGGDLSVLVAVVDTGIDYNHPDLAANYVPLGYDWVNNDPNPMDDYGHGTHVAGIIAAAINNSIGIAGLAQVRIMAEKVMDASGSGSSSDIARGIVHAVDRGAKIVNLSLGSPLNSELMHEAVKYAYDHGVLVVAAAGNDATNAKSYPAAYNEVVAVTATDKLDKPATFTNYGDWVTVAAPGVDILSTMPTYHVTLNDEGYAMNYDSLSGTSMASPHVAGVAALIWSRFPNMTRDQVQAQLQYSADDLGQPGFDIYYGFGRIDARRAVEQAPSDHDVLVLNMETPSNMSLGKAATLNTTVLNMGTSNETNVTVQLLVNGSVVNSTRIDFLTSGASTTLSFVWSAAVDGVYNATSYAVPVTGETIVGNNAVSKEIRVRAPRIIRVPSDYATIQGAIDAANEGDTVSVASGTYFENLWINKEGLTLVGEDASSTIIYGIGLSDVIYVSADHVKIDGFTIQHSGWDYYGGILLQGSSGSTVSNTVILDNFFGILIDVSAGVTLRNNTIAGNVYNFGVDGDSVTDFVHDIDTSNTVNGKPVYYWVNEHDKQVSSDVGYLGIVNSTNIIVKDLNLAGNYEGILFAYTNNSFIQNVNASNSYLGAYLAYSQNNTVYNNTLMYNQYGLYLYESECNNVNQNTLRSNGFGLGLYSYSKGNSVDSNKLLLNYICLYIQKSDSNTINGNEASNSTYGLLLEESSYNVLRRNNMTNNTYNFGVDGDQLAHFINDIDTSNGVNGEPIVYLVNVQDLTIDPSAFSETGYLGIVNSTNINVKNLNFSDNVQGILFAYTNGSTIEGINATNNHWGILMIGSGSNNVSQSNLADNGYGLVLWHSEDNMIYGNIMRKGQDGIFLEYSTHNNVIDNIVTGNAYDGILLVSSNSNGITNDTVSNNGYGAELYYSGSSILRDNIMTGNYYNFGVEGYLLSDFIQNVDTSNTVDGKPVYYWVNQHDKQVPVGAGYIAVVNSTNITVANLAVANNVQGILFAYTANSAVANLSITNNVQGILFAYTTNSVINGNNVTKSDEDGIGLYYSGHNMIAVNTVSDTLTGIDIYASDNNTVNSNSVSESGVGIYPYYSDNNIVINNKVSGSYFSVAGIALTGAEDNMISGNEVAHNTFFRVGAGIYLEWSSDNNAIVQNTVSNNNYGISIGSSGPTDQDDNNTIIHNNLIDNNKQALSLHSLNVWDDGYPSGGNYWSDYNGTDLLGGPYQNLTGSDGIGDTPYSIDINNKDRFPYMIEIRGPYIKGDLNHDGKVDVKDVAAAAAAFGSYPGQPRWNPTADVNQDGKIDIRDIAFIAKNFGKSWT
jgi:thermitase